MSKVFVVQEPSAKVNILPAGRFGELQPPMVAAGRQVMINGRHTILTMAEQLRHFTDVDYILSVGDPVAIGIACSLVAHFNHGLYRQLKWDRQEQEYYSVTVDLNVLPNYPRGRRAK